MHPQLGDAGEEGEPELQERALAGDEAFPWADHPEDRRNPASRGLPRELVLTTPLRHLSHEALGPGLGTPSRRPSAARWAEALHDAAALTLECASCTGGFYLNRERCPFCDTPRAAFVLMKFRRWEPSRSQAPKLMEPHVAVCTRPQARPQVRTARLTEGDTGGAGQRPRVELSSDGKRLSVRCLDGSCIATAPDGGQPVEIGNRRRAMPFDWLLHFGPLDSPHRTAQFEPFPEVQPSSSATCPRGRSPSSTWPPSRAACRRSSPWAPR